jgi:hypothetical protein
VRWSARGGPVWASAGGMEHSQPVRGEGVRARRVLFWRMTAARPRRQQWLMGWTAGPRTSADTPRRRVRKVPQRLQQQRACVDECEGCQRVQRKQSVGLFVVHALRWLRPRCVPKWIRRGSRARPQIALDSHWRFTVKCLVARSAPSKQSRRCLTVLVWARPTSACCL